jgi:MoxR-like ATPase
MTSHEYTGQKTDFYHLDEGQSQVADTINLAMALNRPILVEGEPGCGKTQLAYSIAKEMADDFDEKPVKIMVKSTSRAQDLLYRVDSLRRLQDIQGSQRSDKAQYIYPYIKLGLLGQAIHNRKKRAVVLIDEIDKADIDFPNDLLEVLDQFTFQIDDLPIEEEAKSLQDNQFGREIKAKKGLEPLIVITSNREKRLPEPFLRRCLYIRLRFPETAEALRVVLKKNLQHVLDNAQAEHINSTIAETATQAFLTVRQKARESNVQKLPSTGELIDWVHILHRKGKTDEDIRKNPAHLPPYWELLFKSMQDLDQYAQAAKS